jgi:predicted nicotinamide N-methyase
MRLRVRYQTIEFEGFDIHLRTLRDRQQVDQRLLDEAEARGVWPAHWGLSGVLWDSGRALAERMCTQAVEGLRVLEVGCGVALPSLVLNERGAHITSSDHNPNAGSFLQANVDLNEGPEIPFLQCDWREPRDDVGEFDLIIGSDLLYEPDHAEHLSAFIARHAAPVATVILVDPGRGHVGAFIARMESLGFRATRESVAFGETGKSGRLSTFVRGERPPP